MSIYLLEARFEARQSFYNKATIIIKEDGTKILRSYTTEVASVSPKGEVKINGYYSRTTLRHIKEFLLQEGYSVETIKKLQKEALENFKNKIENIYN